MQTAAIIVGIDNYATKPLTSAVNDAYAFRDALIARQIVNDLRNITLLTTAQPPDKQPTRDNIVDELHNFFRNGDPLGRLIFFFAGHGILTFSDAARGRTRTVLIPTDVRDLDSQGNRLIDLNEVLDFMRRAGPQEQIFIVDACRDLAWDKHPTVGVLGWTPRDSGTGERAQATLYAVSEKGQALGQQNGMGFMSTHLIDGLKGNGIAKVFDDATNSWVVTARSLLDYVKKEVGRGLSGPPNFMVPQLHAPDPQISEILSLQNVGDEQLIIHINPDESAADTTVLLKMRNSLKHSLPPRQNHEKLMLEPFWYRIEASHPLCTPVPAWRNVDLRDEHEVDIVVPLPGMPPASKGPPAPTRGPQPPEPPPSPVVAPATSEEIAISGAIPPRPDHGHVSASALENQVAIELESLQPPYKSWLGYGTLDEIVPVGPYHVRFRLGRDVFNESDIYVQEERVNISATTAVTPLLKEALSIGDETPRDTQISESIGFIQSGVLQTLLPIVGIKPFDIKNELFLRFSGLVEPRKPEEFEMRPLSIVIAFDGEWSDSIYELINETSCDLLLSSGESAEKSLRFEPLVRAKLDDYSRGTSGGLERIGVALTTAPHRAFTVLIKTRLKNIRLASAGLHDRASVITVTLRANGSVDVSQNILRLPGRDELYAEELVSHVPYGQVLRQLQLGQQLFKSDELVSDQFFKTSPDLIKDLFYAKWTDPIMSCMGLYAWYDYMHGRPAENNPFDTDLLLQTANNLHNYFRELPDAHLVFGLLHDSFPYELDFLQMENQIPLLARGLRHMARLSEGESGRVAEIASRIEVDQPWTVSYEPRIDFENDHAPVYRSMSR